MEIPIPIKLARIWIVREMLKDESPFPFFSLSPSLSRQRKRDILETFSSPAPPPPFPSAQLITTRVARGCTRGFRFNARRRTRRVCVCVAGPLLLHLLLQLLLPPFVFLFARIASGRFRNGPYRVRTSRGKDISRYYENSACVRVCSKNEIDAIAISGRTDGGWEREGGNFCETRVVVLWTKRSNDLCAARDWSKRNGKAEEEREKGNVIISRGGAKVLQITVMRRAEGWESWTGGQRNHTAWRDRNIIRTKATIQRSLWFASLTSLRPSNYSENYYFYI